ncbi:MAG: hypothetical protein KTR25_13870 [Myxococcales bacterium]|nr:hypothetical protein [Myxococcales bacterium]
MSKGDEEPRTAFARSAMHGLHKQWLDGLAHKRNFFAFMVLFVHLRLRMLRGAS